MALNPFAAAALLAVAAPVASASSAPSTTITVSAPVATAVVREALRRDDGPFVRPWFMTSCRPQAGIAGPLPTPAPGSAQAAPGYQWIQDYQRTGACLQSVF